MKVVAGGLDLHEEFKTVKRAMRTEGSTWYCDHRVSKIDGMCLDCDEQIN